MKRKRGNGFDQDSTDASLRNPEEAIEEAIKPMREIMAIVASVRLAWNAELDEVCRPLKNTSPLDRTSGLENNDQTQYTHQQQSPQHEQTEMMKKEIAANKETIERLTDKLAKLENKIQLDGLYDEQPIWARILMKARLISFNDKFGGYPSVPYIWLGSNELVLYELWGDYVKIATTIGLRSFCGLFLNTYGKPVNYSNISKNGPNSSKIRPGLPRATRDRLKAALFP